MIASSNNSTVSRDNSTVSRDNSTVSRVYSTNHIPLWKKNYLKSFNEHGIINNVQSDYTEPVSRRSLRFDRGKIMFSAYYKIEIYLRVDHSVDAFLSIRDPDDDDWELLGGVIDCGKKSFVPDLMKKVSHAVKFNPGHVRSSLGFANAMDFDYLWEFMDDDFAESDLVAIMTFDSHCDTGIALKTYAEYLDDSIAGYLFG